MRTHQVGLIATGPTRGDAWAASAWAGVDGWMDEWMDGDGGRGENSGSRSIL